MEHRDGVVAQWLLTAEQSERFAVEVLDENRVRRRVDDGEQDVGGVWDRLHGEGES